MFPPYDQELSGLHGGCRQLLCQRAQVLGLPHEISTPAQLLPRRQHADKMLINANAKTDSHCGTHHFRRVVPGGRR